jgi:hypothetical protein
MFAKVYEQIFDSSIAEDYQVRHMFEDLLKLSDPTGAVDMTIEAIQRRINVPLEIVVRTMTELQKPDPKSRSPKEDGRRIVLIDSHRDWGWKIVNYAHYRKLRDEEARRSYFRDYMQQYRAESGSQKTRKRKPRKINDLPVKHVNTCKHVLTQEEEEEEVEGVASDHLKIPGNRSLAQSTAEHSTINGKCSAVKSSLAEKKFLSRCAEVFGSKSMANFGGRWRNLYRADHQKAVRAVEEVAGEMKSKPISNPGGYAYDLFKRFA